MIYFFQYYTVLIFILFSIFLSIILFLVSYLASSSYKNFEKLSSYECGFEPFDDVRTALNIQFYIVGILFLIFDLEIVFLLPWSVCAGNLGIFPFWLMIIFIVILTLGFIYEWKRIIDYYLVLNV